jgi:hypothetical protein
MKFTMGNRLLEHFVTDRQDGRLTGDTLLELNAIRQQEFTPT